MNIFHSFMEWMSHYGGWVYFPVVYLQAMGLPLPGQSGLVAGSLLAANGKMNLAIILVAAFSGSVLGNATGYAIGRLGGKKLVNRFASCLNIQEKHLHIFEKMLNKRGFWFIICARFIAVSRQLNGLIAGTGGMNFASFMTANIIGAGLWVSTWGLVPYYLHKIL